MRKLARKNIAVILTIPQEFGDRKTTILPALARNGRSCAKELRNPGHHDMTGHGFNVFTIVIFITALVMGRGF